MDTDSFIVHVKSEDVYADLVHDDQTICNKSNNEPDRPLHIGKTKKGIGIMKDKLGGGIMKEFVVLRQRMYSCLTDFGSNDKKGKEQKEMRNNTQK